MDPEETLRQLERLAASVKGLEGTAPAEVRAEGDIVPSVRNGVPKDTEGPRSITMKVESSLAREVTSTPMMKDGAAVPCIVVTPICASSRHQGLDVEAHESSNLDLPLGAHGKWGWSDKGKWKATPVHDSDSDSDFESLEVIRDIHLQRML